MAVAIAGGVESAVAVRLVVRGFARGDSALEAALLDVLVGGESVRAAARRYGLGRSTLARWVGRVREMSEPQRSQRTQRGGGEG